jgi:hypothetical protein
VVVPGHPRLGQPAGARQLTPATGGPGLEELSRALAEHDVTVAGSSLSNEEAQAAGYG